MPTHFDQDKNPEDERFEQNPGQAHSGDKKDIAAKEEATEGGGSYNPNADNDERKAALGDFDEAVEGKGGSGGFYSGDSNANSGAGKSRMNRLLEFAKSPSGRKKSLIGGGAAAGGLAIIISGMFALLPLKIAHMTTNLEEEYFGAAEDAVGKQSENLFSHYVRKHVLPSLGPGCPDTRVSKSCIGDIKGSSQASRLYQGWKDARLENDLAVNHGIEFEKRGTKYFMKVPNNPETEIPGSFLEDGSQQQLSDLGRGEVREKWKAALKQQTRWNKVMYRYKVGRLLERKYGVRRCIVACKLKDGIADWKDNKKRNAAKLIFANRILEPRAEAMSLVLDCFLDGGCEKANDKDDEGRSAMEKELQEKLASYAAKFGEEAAEEIVQKAERLLEKGFSTYMTEKLVEKVAGKTAGKAVGTAIPYVGALNTASTVVQFVKNTGPAVKKMTVAVNGPVFVGTFAAWRTIADEQKTGNMDSTMLGSFSNQLGENARGDGTGVSAEASPMYQALFSKNPNQTALFNGFMPTSVYAQSNDSTQKRYLCDDGQPPAAGELTCNEEQLQPDNFFTQSSEELEKPPLNVVTEASNIWEVSGGQVFDLIDKGSEVAVGAIPGLEELAENAPDFAGTVMDTAGDKMIPSPASDNMDGGRTFHLMAGGADLAGNEFIHTGLGGAKVSDAEAAAYRDERDNRQHQEFLQRPFFARMFSTDTPYSFTSRLAMSIPIDTAAAPRNFVTGTLSNPFRNVSSVWSGAFNKTASARPAEDPYGIDQYLFRLDHPVFTTDPEKYDDEYCTAFNKEWFKDTQTDPDSGMETHSRENPCLLNTAATGSAGGYNNPSVLTPDDLTGSNNQSTTAPQQASSENLFMLGDSYTVGMKGSGGLEAKLTEKGWKPTIDAACGRPLDGTGEFSSCSQPPAFKGFTAIEQPANQDAIKAAGVIVVALGTNDLGGSPENFKTNVNKMVDELKKLNPGAKIYWVNMYVGTESLKGNVEPFNAVLSEAAAAKGITIIDWFSKAGPYYSQPDLLHPNDYNAIVDVVVGAIGEAPEASP